MRRKEGNSAVFFALRGKGERTARGRRRERKEERTKEKKSKGGFRSRRKKRGSASSFWLGKKKEGGKSWKRGTKGDRREEKEITLP